MGVDTAYSNNVLKNSVKRSDIVTDVAANIFYKDQFSKANIDLSYDGLFETYSNNSFDDEVYIDGRAFLGYSLLANRLLWTLQQSQKTKTVNRFDADSPINKDSRSTFQTGPILTLRPTNVDQLQLQSLYFSTEFRDTTTQDNEGVAGNVQWTRQINPLTYVRLIAEYSDIEFDSSVLEYRKKSYGLGFGRTIKQGMVRAQYGFNKIDRENGFSADASYANLELDFNFAVFSGGVRYRKELDDTSSDIDASDLFSDSSSIDAGLAIIDIYERQQLDITIKSLDRSSTLGLWGITLQASEDNYLTSLLSEKRQSIKFDYRYNLSRSLEISFDAQYSKADREGVDAFLKYDSSKSTVRLVYSPTNRLSLYLGGQYRERDDDFRGGYNESRLTLGFNYSFGLLQK